MAAKRKSNIPAEIVSADEKIARIMALNAMKDMDGNNDKSVFLRSAGFTVNETAAILNITDPAQVRVALKRSQKKKRRPK